MLKFSVLVAILSVFASSVLSDSSLMNATTAVTGAGAGTDAVTTAPSSPYAVLNIHSVSIQASFFPFGNMNYNRKSLN